LLYTANRKRVGRWWEISVAELDEVTQARTLDEVPAAVADLAALMTDADPAKVKVTSWRAPDQAQAWAARL
jgi:hypothetical protein